MNREHDTIHLTQVCVLMDVTMLASSLKSSASSLESE